MRIVIAEDSVLFREGLVRLMTDEGHDIVAAVGDADQLIDAVRTCRPDLAIIDVRMPPTLTDEGARAARALRGELPGQPILLLSRRGDSSLRPPGRIRRVRLSPQRPGLEGGGLPRRGTTSIGWRISARPRIRQCTARLCQHDGPLETLSGREREVLSLAAEGRTNAAIARRLVLTERTVETHMRTIFQRLRLSDSGDDHRRVLAVVTYLTSAQRGG